MVRKDRARWARHLAGLLLAGSLAAPCAAEVIQLGTSPFLTNTPEVKLRSSGIDDDQIGTRLIGVGDVNGDGRDDIVVGRDLPGGSHYVVFGTTGPATLNLSTLDDGTSTAGFRIVSEPGGFSISSIGAAGDVNGDGLADILLGRRSASTPAGRAWVVFGKTALGNVELATVASGTSTLGFALDGPLGSNAGADVGGLGDLNGDGLADIVVGAPGLGAPGGAFVVFGRTATSNVALSQLVAGTSALGFVINGAAPGERTGVRAKGAGDFNGDGFPDILLGDRYADLPVGTDAGQAMVIFGKSTTTPVEISAILAGTSTAGLVFNSTAAGELLGRAVAGLGDVNGDGLADVIVGAAVVGSGRAYVVFGHSASGTLELSGLVAGTSPHGFIAEGQGAAMGAAGDYDGDGLADVLIGAPGAAVGAFSGAGRAYLVLGRTANTPVALTTLHDGLSPLGMPMEGVALNDNAGSTLASAGDYNGDGRPDSTIGAPLHDVFGSGRVNGGAVFVLTRPNRAFANASTYRSYFRSGAAPRAGVGTHGYGQDTTLYADSRFYVQFVGGTGPSPTDVTVHRTRDVVFGLNASKIADVAWFATSPRTGYRQANVTLRYTADEIAGLDTANLRVFTAASPTGPWSAISPAATFNLVRRQASLSVAALDRWYAIGEFDAALIQNGDANADGRRDVADVTAIHNFVEGLVGSLAGDGDVDNVNGVEAADAALLADHLVNGTPLP